MKRFKRPGQQGVGIVELLIYVTITTMLLLLTSQFIINMIRGQRRASEVQRVHQSVRRIVSIANYDLRRATAITPASSTFGSDNGVLTFVDSSGTTVRYDLSNGILRRQYGAGNPEAMTTNAIRVESFNLTYLADTGKSLESVRMTMVITGGFASTAHFYRQSYTTSITLR